MRTDFAILTSVAMACLAGGVFAESSCKPPSSTFFKPNSRDRPRFRYWLPDASVDLDILKDDVAQAARIGAGGLEFVPFYNYGGDLGGPPPGHDWSKYGFGTPAYLKVLHAAADAHAENGLYMDLPFGPSEGQGVPAYPDDDGLQWDLVRSLSTNDNSHELT